ncbi:MAG: S-methyl-5'-thioadenosine phosphorylase [Candidatus Omnitrophota bacterium]
MGKIGIIGGSGIYKMENIGSLKEVRVKTPFGEPSDAFRVGEIDGTKVVFLPRHGRDHSISPSEINYRANIFGMKKLGVDRLVSVSACGSLKKELKPLDFVLPDQFVDRTNSGRKMTFFEGGVVVHVGFAQPVCPELTRSIYETGKSLGLTMHKGGTYLNMEGPAFSTKAESLLYRSWGMDIIGMTNMAEARLAREAEMCYATLAAITDYDCWYESEEPVTVDMVIANLTRNAENSKKLMKEVIGRLGTAPGGCACGDALKYAIVTDKKAVSAKVKKDLSPIIGKYMR